MSSQKPCAITTVSDASEKMVDSGRGKRRPDENAKRFGKARRGYEFTVKREEI